MSDHAKHVPADARQTFTDHDLSQGVGQAIADARQMPLSASLVQIAFGVTRRDIADDHGLLARFNDAMEKIEGFVELAAERGSDDADART